jgi:hypothetical protein
VPNAPSCRIKVDAVLHSESLDLLVFPEICCGGILDVMVKGEDDLLWAIDLRSSHRHELEGDRPRVIVGHAVLGGQTDIVAAPNELSLRQIDRIALYNLFRQSLR